MISKLPDFYALQAQIESFAELTLTQQPTTSDSVKVSSKGYTNQNFEIGIKIFADHQTLGIYYNINARTDKKRGYCNKTEKAEILANVYEECLIDLDFAPSSNAATTVTYQSIGNGADDLFEKFQKIHAYLEDKGMFENLDKGQEFGVKFEGTQFDRLRERGATLSPMFMKLVCAVSNMNLGNLMGEYEHAGGGQIDGVERENDSDPNAAVITLFECQSGIHLGEYLDDEHANKILSQYLYGDTHTYTVKKLVLLAGGYKQKHLDLFRDWVANNPGKKVYLLRTAREGNQIKIETVDLYKSVDPIPQYLDTVSDRIDVTDIIERLESLEKEQTDLKQQLRTVLEQQQIRPSIISRLFKS